SDLHSSFVIRPSYGPTGRALAFTIGSSYVASMPTLLEKIAASAAERLPLPPNRQPSQELARYKNFLKVESHRLKILHRAGAGGREMCRALAALADVWRGGCCGGGRDTP